MMYDNIVEIVKSTKKIVLNETMQKDVHLKGQADFVTAVDTEVSAWIKQQLSESFPGHGFFSEEEKSALSDPCWILDPIDGTTNLVYGYRQSSVSLALYKDGEIAFGVVYNPFTDECFTAYKKNGAFLGGKRITVSNRSFSQSIIEFGAGSTHKQDADDNFLLAKQVFNNVVDLRRICSSALSICYIADGRIDGYFEKILKPWDYAAGSLILTEAGGVLSDYSGAPLRFDCPTTIIAGNVDTHKNLLQIIHKHYS